MMKNGHDRRYIDCCNKKRLESTHSLQRGEYIFIVHQHQETSLCQQSSYRHHVIIKAYSLTSNDQAAVCNDVIKDTTNMEINIIKYHRILDLICNIINVHEYAQTHHMSFHKQWDSSVKKCVECNIVKQYGLSSNNCEHFVTWCLVGKVDKFQDQSLIPNLKNKSPNIPREVSQASISLPRKDSVLRESVNWNLTERLGNYWTQNFPSEDWTESNLWELWIDVAGKVNTNLVDDEYYFDSERKMNCKVNETGLKLQCLIRVLNEHKSVRDSVTNIIPHGKISLKSHEWADVVVEDEDTDVLYFCSPQQDFGQALSPMSLKREESPSVLVMCMDALAMKKLLQDNSAKFKGGGRNLPLAMWDIDVFYTTHKMFLIRLVIRIMISDEQVNDHVADTCYCNIGDIINCKFNAKLLEGVDCRSEVEECKNTNEIYLRSHAKDMQSRQILQSSFNATIACVESFPSQSIERFVYLMYPYMENGDNPGNINLENSAKNMYFTGQEFDLQTNTCIWTRCLFQTACAVRYLHNSSFRAPDIHEAATFDRIFLAEYFDMIIGDFGIAVEVIQDTNGAKWTTVQGINDYDLCIMSLHTSYNVSNIILVGGYGCLDYRNLMIGFLKRCQPFYFGKIIPDIQITILDSAYYLQTINGLNLLRRAIDGTESTPWLLTLAPKCCNQSVPLTWLGYIVCMEDRTWLGYTVCMEDRTWLGYTVCMEDRTWLGYIVCMEDRTWLGYIVCMEDRTWLGYTVCMEGRTWLGYIVCMEDRTWLGYIVCMEDRTWLGYSVCTEDRIWLGYSVCMEDRTWLGYSVCMEDRTWLGYSVCMEDRTWLGYSVCMEDRTWLGYSVCMEDRTWLGYSVCMEKRTWPGYSVCMEDRTDEIIKDLHYMFATFTALFSSNERQDQHESNHTLHIFENIKSLACNDEMDSFSEEDVAFRKATVMKMPVSSSLPTGDTAVQEYGSAFDLSGSISLDSIVSLRTPDKHSQKCKRQNTVQEIQMVDCLHKSLKNFLEGKFTTFDQIEDRDETEQQIQFGIMQHEQSITEFNEQNVRDITLKNRKKSDFHSTIWHTLNPLPLPSLSRDVIVHFFEGQTTNELREILTQLASDKIPETQTMMKFEMLRLCTMKGFPKGNRPFAIRIIEAGFYYGGCNDQVVCYCCGSRKDNWVREDIPLLIHRKLAPKCSFLINNAVVNIPIRKSNSPESTAVVRLLAIHRTDGSIPSDPTQGVSSLMLPSSEQNHMKISKETCEMHVTYSSPPIHLASSEGQNVMDNQHSSIVNINSVKEPQPKYPHYAVKSIRINSFHGWPADVHQRPEEMAECGFYFAGFNDCVRCFHCGVGLRHWMSEDDPWVEHARWSTSCFYVYKMKGEEFVSLVKMAVEIAEREETKQNNRSNQPPTNNTETSTADTVKKDSQNNKANDSAVLRESTSSTGTTCDAAGSAAASTAYPGNADIQKYLLTDAAQSVLDMGYQPKLVQRAIEKILMKKGPDEMTGQIILEVVFEIEEEGSANSKSETSSQSAQQKERNEKVYGAAEGDSGHIDPEKIRREHRELREVTLCKICMDNTSSVVFLPCGHLVTCPDCAPAMRKCPICRTLIKGTVKIFFG